jgi:hypothetical protein
VPNDRRRNDRRRNALRQSPRITRVISERIVRFVKENSK